jgi:L-ascorbate metabolism protein UlaG (beta-lactamase superfamily)
MTLRGIRAKSIFSNVGGAVPSITPQVKFLNHSCLIISDGITSILCDPWFKGAAFDNGWRLIVEESHDITEIDFDYIWISHEHPDHFSPLTLSGLTRPVKFLYQKTRDGKIAAYLKSKGHTVIELEDGHGRFNDFNEAD